MVAAADFDLGFVGNRLAGFIDPSLANKDKPGKDQRLRALAAFNEAAIDEKLVGPALYRH
jgi:hypothetical protein